MTTPGEDRVQQALARWRALPDDDPWREDIELIYARLRAVEAERAAAQKAMIHLRASTHGYRPDACDGCGDLAAALAP